MKDYLDDAAKARIRQALKQTQVQSEEAAAQVGTFLRIGAKKLREAADKAKSAIQRDIESR